MKKRGTRMKHKRNKDREEENRKESCIHVSSVLRRYGVIPSCKGLRCCVSNQLPGGPHLQCRGFLHG